MGDNDCDGSSGIRGNDIYKGSGEELVLALLSDLYLELEMVSYKC